VPLRCFDSVAWVALGFDSLLVVSMLVPVLRSRSPTSAPTPSRPVRRAAQLLGVSNAALRTLLRCRSLVPVRRWSVSLSLPHCCVRAAATRRLWRSASTMGLSTRCRSRRSINTASPGDPAVVVDPQHVGRRRCQAAQASVATRDRSQARCISILDLQKR
jgi:hypothetical protein